MPIQNETLGMIGKAAGGTVLGMAAGAFDNWMQRKQQERLMQQQIKGQKEMGRFNQQLALELWDKTNYEAQRKHMEAAGLNVGLMYGMGGGGGATASTPTGNVTGGTAAAGMGIQLGVQKALADIELTKAQKENVQADTENKEGAQREQMLATIENLKQTTSNAKIQGAIQQLEKDMMEMDKFVKSYTQNDVISTILATRDKFIQEAKSAKADADVKEATVETSIKLANQALLEQGLRMSLMQADIIKTGAQTKEIEQSIKKMATEMMAIDLGLSFEARKVRVQEILQKFTTAEEAWIGRDVDTVTKVLNTLAKFVEAVMPQN